jgi:hypothetical protein
VLARDSRSRQAGHPLVGDQQRHLFAPGADLPEELEPLGARAGAHHAIPLAETAPQIAGDGSQHGRLVVDRHDRGSPPLLSGSRLIHVRTRHSITGTMLRDRRNGGPTRRSPLG